MFLVGKVEGMARVETAEAHSTEVLLVAIRPGFCGG